MMAVHKNKKADHVKEESPAKEGTLGVKRNASKKPKEPVVEDDENVEVSLDEIEFEIADKEE